MKTYGEMSLVEGSWQIKADPHVMLRLKNVIGRFAKHQFGTLTVKNSPEICRDLEWFTGRYPLRIKHQCELVDGAARHRQTLEHLEKILLPEHVPQYFELAKPLRDYQARGLEVLLAKGRLLCADQLGLGKTAIGIGAMTQPENLPGLIVVQTHLAKQWASEFGAFMPFATTHIINKQKTYDLPEADVYIITYHKLHAWAEVLSKFIRCVVFDEVQELRHEGTGKWCAANAIADGAQRRLGLSATPIYNYGGEIFNIYEVIAPGELGEREEFEREWCRHHGDHWVLKDPEAFGAHLKDQFLMIRRTRKDVGRELPPMQTIVHTIEYSEECLDQIKDVATELAHRILNGTFMEKGLAAREFDMRLRQATGIAKAPFAAAFVKMLVDEGERVILTGWHREVYEIWQAHFDEMKLKWVMFTGSETPAQKENAVRDFVNGDAQVFIMSLRSGAGIDGLQRKASTIVHGELDWSPGVHEQCSGRLFRDGQTERVSQFYLVADGGSDPIVANVLGIKTAQVQGLLQAGALGLKRNENDDGARVKRMAEAYLKRR
ncbi:MAG TPA: DEAD/DEAH box helicase [Verrucomicrobiae bacterium]|nr:DEAD/DEAH box helicase [Verrucomicrobiae bacterium]